jgi:cytochrome P450
MDELTISRSGSTTDADGDDRSGSRYDPSRDNTHSRLHRRGEKVVRVDYGGGIWLVAGYDTVLDVLTDDSAFASKHDLPNGSSPFMGVMAPPTPIRAVPIEVDPPAFRGYRKLLARRFSSSALADLMPTIEKCTQWCIDRRIASGHIDLFHDLAKLVPAMVTMKLIGLPMSNADEIANAVHRRGEDRFALSKTWALFTQQVFETMRARKQHPEDDLISYLLDAQIDGRHVSETELLELCFTMVIGGMSTTAKLALGALTYLGVHTDERARIIDGSVDLEVAMEEFLRYYSPVPVLCRTATRDIVLSGRTVQRGERLGVGFAAANRDPSVFEDPDHLNLHRQPNQHLAFGHGIHYCIGATLGKTEALVMLRHVLARIPDYQIDVQQMHDFLNSAEAAGSSWGTRLMVGLPAQFRPASRVSPIVHDVPL